MITTADVLNARILIVDDLAANVILLEQMLEGAGYRTVSSTRDSSAPISFTGDLILLAYLLGLGRFFTASAALDTGSAFEGMGAAREVTFACLAEPAYFFGLLVLARLSGSLSLTGMLGSTLASAWAVGGASLVLVFDAAALLSLPPILASQ